MRWPWRRKPQRKDCARDRAERAIELSRQQAAEARRRLAEDQRLAARFRELRQKNHFAEAFARALREGR